jgi:hypothetical protein
MSEHRQHIFGVAEDFGPIAEGEIGGDQQRGVHRLADEVEQELAAGLAGGQISESRTDGARLSTSRSVDVPKKY